MKKANPKLLFFLILFVALGIYLVITDSLDVVELFRETLAFFAELYKSILGGIFGNLS